MKKLSRKKMTLVVIIAVVAVIVIALAVTLGVVLSREPDVPNTEDPSIDTDFPSENTEPEEVQIDFVEVFAGKVNQWSETLGYVERNIPSATSNEGLNSRYPTYGTSLAGITDEEKTALLDETALLFASNTTYDAMDASGNYYINGSATGKKLYKHTSAVGMYYGDVDDDEPAVTQKITVTAREVRNYVTGLYAPAGEVVKIEISEDDLKKIGGELKVIVGQVSHRNVVNNIWKARSDFSRMPVIANTLSVKSTVAYVGNPLGGPIYIYPESFGETFSVTISGAVKYAHYIHGQTTADEVEEMLNYSAPYYDFEVWDLGVRHSGPKLYGSYDFDNLVKCGDLWEKIVRTSRQVPCSANATIGVGYVYDCFVAAGAACAFQGGHSWVNAPCSWLRSALDYDSMVSEGFWGTIHEYNHLYQSYGMEGSKTNEVTNNATSLLSYALYTKISEKRSLDDGTISGWNRFTDPSRSLRETLSIAEEGNPQSSLNAYADLIHTFGADVFTAATRAQKNGFTADDWYTALSSVTDYNFTYYFEDILHQTLSADVKALYDTSDRITFVPVATVFQTGRSYYRDGVECFAETVRPFLIERGESLTMDFNERLILPADYSFRIKSFSAPESGTLEKIGENIYKYTPGENDFSGTMELKVELIGAKSTKDITITIALRQYSKNQVEITKYTFGGETKYTTVADALANDFSGYTEKNTYKNSSTFFNGLANSQIGVAEGKIYIEKSSRYALCLRSGRGNNTLYIAVNDESYREVLSLNTDHGGFALDGEHVVVLDLKAGDYLRFMEITLSRHYADAFSELGIADLNESTPTMRSVPTAMLYTKDAVREDGAFTSDEKYKREYTAERDLLVSASGNHTLVSANMSSWSDDESIENIFDGNPDTYYHNERNNFLSADNPFILVADIGAPATFNSIKIISRTSGQYNLPVTFTLFGSLDMEEWFTVGEFINLPTSANTVSANFTEAEFRYYKLHVTQTKAQSSPNQYITISQIELSHTVSGKELSPFAFEYYKTDETDFYAQSATSEFGRLIIGNGTVKYTLEGMGLALTVRQKTSAKIRVTAGDTVTEYMLDQTEEPSIAFLYRNTTEGAVDIKVEVLEGNIYIDSAIVY